MSWLTTLLHDPNSIGHILLVYATVIALGMALGRIKVFGVSLGVTLVLFVGLAAGHFGWQINPTVQTFVKDFGLILFVFFIGLQVGPSFFESFKSGGVLLNGLMLLAIFLSIAITIVLYFVFADSISLAQILGVHYGAVTNTPGLGATQEALSVLGYQGENIAVAYACAYPLGVISIIFTAIVLRLVFRVDIKEEDKHWEEDEQNNNDMPIFFHVTVTNPALEGRTIEETRQLLSRPFICSRILKNDEIISPSPETVLHLDEKLRIVAAREHKRAIVAFCGEEDKKIDLATKHSPVTARTLTVTQAKLNGLHISDLYLTQYDGVNITRIFRAGLTLFPYQGIRLQLGDQLYCVGPERAIERLASHLGNQSKKLDHPNIIAVFIGIGLGILLGSLPIAVPGMPVPLKLGLAGGPLIIAILLGRFGMHAHLITYTTNSANLMLREIGIALFLASVGLAAGDSFVKALMSGHGFLYVGLGLLITVIPLLIVGILARKVFKINYHSIVGMIAGATTDPPTLAYANTLSEKNSAAVAYTTVYPLAMFMRILSGQMILLIMWEFVS